LWAPLRLCRVLRTIGEENEVRSRALNPLFSGGES
jgi:hypothetical protein